MLIKVLPLVLALTFTACKGQGNIEEAVAKALKEKPQILVDAIEANPMEIMEAIQTAARSAQAKMAEKREQEEAKKLEEAYSKPLQPEIRKDEAIRGTKGAPITLVEYSDFECPFCTRGFDTVLKLMEKYKGKVAFIYKHLPLSFHKNAEVAARYYEGLRIQDEQKAFKFHDELFKNQSKIKNGEPYLKKIAKSLGADMKKLSKDVQSSAVAERIQADQAEAAKFGIQGTPGFILNGVPIKGAYPVEHFEQVINELKKRGRVNL
ncbi:MAG: DsbA family protein [Bdellovibrionales bacterium]|jgi:protein-disulfide isomerase|nr:DsbA family protein [Bdellovibrionales bacterium]